MLVATSCADTNSPDAPLGSKANTLHDTLVATDSNASTVSTTVDSMAPAIENSTYSSAAYGAFGLWASATTFEWGPAPFTMSHDNTYANTIITRINTARQKRQRLVLAMTGGPSSNFKTDGKFDLSKWKRRMDTFRTSAIRETVAAAVADGTIIGNTLMNEPETKQWGGIMTKPLLDNMATYVKAIFPTLPVGVNHGAPGYRWHTWERYRKVDYTLNQYMWQNNNGNITAWRDAVLSRARTEGIKAAFSLNLLDGGVPDNSGTWDCKGTGGKGTLTHKCRMTAAQVANYGKAVGSSGCFMLNWRYDDVFMANAANRDAFRSVASVLVGVPPKGCRRA